MLIDKFERAGEGHLHWGDYDSLEEALEIARKLGKEAESNASDSSISTVYYVYDDSGTYKGGDIYKKE